MPDQLLDGSVRPRIDFFFETDLDGDNIIKPIRDALKDVVYEYDKAVVDVCARKDNRQDSPPIVNAPATPRDALSSTRGDSPTPASPLQANGWHSHECERCGA